MAGLGMNVPVLTIVAVRVARCAHYDHDPNAPASDGRYE